MKQDKRSNKAMGQNTQGRKRGNLKTDFETTDAEGESTEGR